MSTTTNDTLITSSRHPWYTQEDFIKYNLTYLGGRMYIDRYLQMFDARENVDDFKRRRSMTYNPGFAAEGLDEIKNGIFQRMPEITRRGGTKSYEQAIQGFLGGVNLEGATMNVFMGQKVLPELLKFGRTGVYVDMPQFNPQATLAEFLTVPHPYVTNYKAEDILNWRVVNLDNELVLTVVLLKECNWEYNAAGLPTVKKDIFRLVQLVKGGVQVTFFEQYIDPQTAKPAERIVSSFFLEKLTRLPFIMLDIGKSILADVADYQNALLNLASADLMYAITSNFPFYVEGYDPKTDNIFGRTGAPQTTWDTEGRPQLVEEATEESSSEITVGTTHGRRYPLGAPAPEFIHPSPEPLKVSMEKQKQMQDEIRRLLNLSVQNIGMARQSAEAQASNQQGLESGLSAIGIELESAERKVAMIWGQYEKEFTPQDKLVVSYPSTYSLKTDEQRNSEATEIQKLQGAAPSKTYAKAIAKKIAKALLEGKVSQDEMATIFKEIEAAKYLSGIATDIASDFEIGIVDSETAAEARGYDPALVKKAQEERVQRMADIAAAQTPDVGAANNAARGGEGNGPPAKDEKTVSQNSDTNPKGGKKVRGKGNGS